LRTLSATVLLTLGLAASATAQVPDGYFVWCSFQSGTKGQTGIFFSHPRTPGNPTAVTGLTPDLQWIPNSPSNQGASCILRTPEGELVVGERAPAGHSVDLHLITLRGNAVYRDVLISTGTSAGPGEICQAGLLPDGRIVVAATGLAAGGALANFKTVSYDWEGVGIIDPVGGLVTPIPLQNSSIPGVFNGLTVNREGSKAYVGTWVSSTQGDIYEIDLTKISAPQTMQLVAQVPVGLSNLGMDLDGNLLVAGLNGPPNLWSFDTKTWKRSTINTQSGALNAVCLDPVTDTLGLVSANAGNPVRSVFWMDAQGNEHLLSSPNMATISGIDINPNPELFGQSSVNVHRYEWQIHPNATGMPLVGNTAFELPIASTGSVSLPGIALLCAGRLETPIPLLGAELWVDPTSLVATMLVQAGVQGKVGLPIPKDPALIGIELFLQSFHPESNGKLAATSGVQLTIL
jgi:hypothetical protein